MTRLFENMNPSLNPPYVSHRWPTVIDSPLIAYLLSALIGIAFAIFIFTPDFLAGGGPFWASPDLTDPQTAIAGGRYYVEDSWHFPLFRTILMMPPYGVSIIYNDSVPLFALIAKIYAKATGASGFYFGYWMLCCYALQGVSFVYLCRSVGVTRLVPALCATVIALSLPEFLFRFGQGHLALCGQFLIPIQLGLYFSNTHGATSRHSWMMLGLCLLTLLLNFYIFVMCLGIFVFYLLQRATAARANRPEVFRQAAILIVLGLAIAVITGYGAGAGATAGYGYFSMNLLSPWVPQESGIFPGAGGVIDGTDGQYEGFNYLGAGILLLLAIAVIGSIRDIPRLLKKYRWLVAFLALSTLFAISDRVYIGNYPLLGHPTAASIAGQLASTAPTATRARKPNTENGSSI